MELFQAHKQWSTRPDDERFTSLQALYDATRAYAQTAVERPCVRVDSLRVENVDGDVQIVGRGNVPARLTHWAFGQLASRVAAPASYLRTLPATLAAQNLNHGLASRVADAAGATVKLLFHTNGSLLLRALTGDGYERIWNWEVADRLLGLQADGWQVATPDFNAGSDGRLPLYASDHDLFAFLAHPDRVIREPGNPDGLRRGLIAENSEVGASKIRLTRFWYRAMCGNHIIWGATDVVDLSAVHVGKVRDRIGLWSAAIRRYADQSCADDESMIARSKSRLIAATKDQVLDALFGRRSLGLSKAVLGKAYDGVVADVDGDPRSPWGIVQGLTRVSQQTSYADDRMAIDRAAGSILTAF